MSLLFADIYDGIRTIRITKGVSEKDILNFVQDKVGGCMKVSNVLKTIRTLKKLCEEGVLMKKGKRYMFAPKGCRKEENDDDDDEEDDECQEEIQPQVVDSCDECDDDNQPEDEPEEEEEEDDDDDDDDDEEEDDDDDDDEDECDDKEDQADNGDSGGKKCNEMETRSPMKSKDSFLGGANSPSPGGNNGDNGNGTPSCLDKKVNRGMAGDCLKKSGNDKEKKSCKGKSIVDQETGDTNKGNEAIAFCVRDFIDSLGQPDGEGKQQSQKSEAMLEENMDLTKPLEFGREISLRKRAFKSKRNAGRSRSPVKEVQAELYHCLGKGPSDEIGFRAVCSDFFQEPTDAEMELDQKEEEKLTTPHRGLPTNSGEPCGEADKDIQGCVIIERSYEDFRESLAKKTSLMSQVQNNECAMGQMTWYPLEETEKEPEAANRSSSCEDERTGGDREKTVSLCSVCEKKKKIP